LHLDAAFWQDIWTWLAKNESPLGAILVFGLLFGILSGWFDTLFGWFHRPAPAPPLDHADKPDPSLANQAQQGGPQSNIGRAAAATVNNHNGLTLSRRI
jgi:hypothetical protein